MSSQLVPRPMFVALTPDQELETALQAWKRRVRELVGPQQYLDHPPHMTLYLALFPEPSRVVQVAAALARMKAPSVEVSGWHIFLADPLTGNHTLVLNLGNSSASRLRQLQARVVQACAPLRDPDQTSLRFSDSRRGLSNEQIASVRSTGFPYVGEGWHPHFTVASIRPADWPAVKADLVRTPPRISASCPRLAVYELIEEHPQLVQSLAFDNGTST